MGGLMVSKRLSIYGFISAAAVISGVLVGCGGSSGGGTAAPIVKTTGGISSGSGTTTTTVTSSTQPQQVQVTAAGSATPVTAIVPPGESFTAGTPIAVVNNNAPIIKGLSIPKTNGEKGAPASGSSGQLYIDGTFSGVTIVNGAFSSPFVLTAGPHILEAFGPFTITGGTVFAPTTLTVGTLSFGVKVTNVTSALGTVSAIPSFPSALTLLLPINGGTLTRGNQVAVTYPAPYLTNSTSLTITNASDGTAGSGQSYAETVVLAAGKGSYTLVHSNTRPIPAAGVASIVFNIN